MEALRAKFVARCREDLDVVRLGSDDPAFRLVVHRLSGIAPMFGFDALGEAATEIDAALIAERSPDPWLVDKLAQALEDTIATVQP